MAADDTRPDIPAAPESSATVTGPAGEELGRLVHDVRLASEAERAEEEGRQRFRLGEWEERTPWQREVDMRIGHAVADYALAGIADLRREHPRTLTVEDVLRITGTGEEP